MENLILGGLFMLAGAICGGSFGLPSKFAKKDTPWEVLWGPFFLFVTIVIPVILAPLLVKDLGSIYREVNVTEVIVPSLIFGLLWGLGSMTLGMSFAFIGLSLAYALNYGAQIVFGSMMPMLIFEGDKVLTMPGYVTMGGVAVCLVGVAVAGRAGILKERSLKSDEPAADPDSAIKRPKILIGLTIGVLSGVLCACFAVAAGYADPIGEKAVKTYGNPDWAAAWAPVTMILLGGAVSSCLYCIVQLTRNKTWGHFAKPGVGLVLLLAAVMAVLHNGALFLLFLGLFELKKAGELFLPVGYPIFMSFAIIVGNVHGFRTGEWKGASRESVQWIIAGIALLIAGVCVLGLAKWLAIE
ncbi:MAG: hypothetical protein HQ567_01685 [Candidatus Nealsonbacteria bacterium]|nr:hypothetical protein [Candidatus Nealsonbacteria bacterium]